MEIEKLRKAIDRIDSELVKLLAEREKISASIGEVKNKNNGDVSDIEREKLILENISKQAEKLKLDKNDALDIFKKIIESSKKAQIKSIKHDCKIKEIGLIGFGRFGKLVARHLSDDFRIFVFDKSGLKDEIRQLNCIPSRLQEASNKEIVVISVPISEMENTLNSMKKSLRKDCIVVDTCSVKEFPAGIMKKILPKETKIIATHPMFGPDSASESLIGRKIALCRIRCDDTSYLPFKKFLQSKGLSLIETTPENHDKEIAKSLVLTHLIGRALIEMNLTQQKIDTAGHQKLMSVLTTVKNDTWQLFDDMNRFNKHSKKIRDDFIKAVNKIDRRIK